jgi:hypothetical protein
MHEIGSCAQSAATGGIACEERLQIDRVTHGAILPRWFANGSWCVLLPLKLYLFIVSVKKGAVPRGGYCRRCEKLPTLSARLSCAGSDVFPLLLCDLLFPADKSWDNFYIARILATRFSPDFRDQAMLKNLEVK